jgi:hypothetical protein
MNEKCHDFLTVADENEADENHNHSTSETTRAELELAPCSRDDDDGGTTSIESSTAEVTIAPDVEGGSEPFPTTDTMADQALDSSKVEPIQ